jgi:release factor glutamine methyltransferase
MARACTAILNLQFNHCKFAAMTIETAGRELMVSLETIYDRREAAAIANLVMEKLTGQPRSVRVLRGTEPLENEMKQLFNRFRNELLNHRPVQYVLNEAWFCGLKFFVNESVLIPRPETEELVSWVQEEIGYPEGGSLLDIGTGSGCIAIALKRRIPALMVSACDISPAALEIASLNAMSNQTDISFCVLDILSPEVADQIPEMQYIVSNPPYIPFGDRGSLSPHVERYEPAEALFVPDGDPLLFYRAIAMAGNRKLMPGGKIFFEIHEDYAAPLSTFLSSDRFNVEIRKDILGKSRMAKLERL